MSQEWEETFVDDVLDWTFLEFEDLRELSELRAAIDYMDDPVQTSSYEDLVDAWNAPGSHAHDHAVVGREKGGSIVAYGWNHPTPSSDPNPQVWFEIGVHPAWRHQHIRHRLTAFAKDWANAHSEAADAKLFWARFYECFGIRPESATLYEKAVDKLGGVR